MPDPAGFPSRRLDRVNPRPAGRGICSWLCVPVVCDSFARGAWGSRLAKPARPQADRPHETVGALLPSLPFGTIRGITAHQLEP